MLLVRTKCKTEIFNIIGMLQYLAIHYNLWHENLYDLGLIKDKSFWKLNSQHYINEFLQSCRTRGHLANIITHYMIHTQVIYIVLSICHMTCCSTNYITQTETKPEYTYVI